MKVVIVQLSDIHLSVEKWPDNPVLSRAERILAAIRSLFVSDASACILLVNGDIAYAGLKAEYELAASFLGGIREGLSTLYGARNVYSVILPGNHDCNFQSDNDARRLLIADVDAKGFGDGSVADICTTIQEGFFQFSRDFHQYTTSVRGIDRIASDHRISIGTAEIVFRVLNTAWCSRINEKAGSLTLPMGPVAPRLIPEGTPHLVITALHHPYRWLEPNNARDLRRAIEESSDLVFTGHEHVAESYSKTGYSGEHNEYIEAGPLQENGTPGNSEFNVVIVDTDASAYIVHHFVWADDIYEEVARTAERPFIRNNSRLQGEYQLHEKFVTELNETDTPYLHPFKDTVYLDDIFIYPDLREFSPTAMLGKGIAGSRPTTRPKNEEERNRARVATQDAPAQARKVSSTLDTVDTKDLVKQLAGTLYREDAANIILFLCHLNRDALVLREVIASAERTFSGTTETDLFEDVKFTGSLLARLGTPVLTQGDPEKRRQERLEAQDAIAPVDDPSDEMYSYRYEEETDQESELRRQIAQINGAFKTIQILGQIARSFAGSLKGDEKRELTEACFGVGLRLLRFAFDTFRLGRDELGNSLKRRIKQRHPEMTDDRATGLANSIIFMLVDMFTYAVIRHVAGAIGVEKLALTFKEVRESKNTIAVRTLDAAIQLEHFENVPESLLIELYRDVKDVLLMQDIVRHLAWDRMYYFRCPQQVQQRLCSALGIELSAATFNPDQKKR